ncbi:MAG: biotin/lipoate A/B protein ligase family protein [Nocardioides sp.]
MTDRASFSVHQHDWRLLVDDDAGAAEGLALDEALMGGVSREAAERRPTLRLYTYASHAALVGRYQTLAAEVDLEACARTGTAVSRRPTGGGAIVMGAGQLGVALTLPASAARPKDLIVELGQGVVTGLAKLGVAAEFGGKNDLIAGGRKIAGLGLYADEQGGLLFHTSLLVDLDVPFMLEVLRVPAAKLADKAALAVGERVTTVRRELGSPIPVGEVRAAVADGFAFRFGVALEADHPTEAEEARAAELVRSKYAHDRWLHEQQAQPNGTGTAVFRSPEGTVRVFVAAQASLTKSVMFSGDFNVLPAGLQQLEVDLRWRRLEPTTVAALVGEVRRQFPDDLGWQRDDDVVQALLEAGSRAVGHEAAHPVRPEGSCYFPEARSTS